MHELFGVRDGRTKSFGDRLVTQADTEKWHGLRDGFLDDVD
jgi:hypothetical protein